MGKGWVEENGAGRGMHGRGEERPTPLAVRNRTQGGRRRAPTYLETGLATRQHLQLHAATKVAEARGPTKLEEN